MAYRYEDIEQASRDRIEKGVVAIRRINSHENFANWMEVGESCAEMQSAAMRLAHTNTPKGGGYNAAYKVIAAANPDLAKLDTATRTHAMWMANNRLPVEEWHASLVTNIRQQVNHPTTVWRRYTKEHAAPQDGAEKPAAGGIKAEVVRLQSELDAMRAENAKLKRTRESVSEGTDWTWQDDIDAIAEVWMRLQPNKAPRIASKVLELSKSTSKKPRAKVNREPAGERHW